jgi:hypothetical protein
MAQEFTINSSAIETKINQLLPSQGGFGAGVDFSASTMVIPIVDLTETAEGSDVRQDLQTALSHTTVTNYFIQNATNTVLVNTTGYYRVFGRGQLNGACNLSFNLFDGTTAKQIQSFGSAGAVSNVVTYDFIVFLPAGNTLRASSTTVNGNLDGVTRQIADISGNLIDP